MADFTTEGIDKYLLDFEEIASLPGDVLEDMVEAGGEIIRKGQATTASSMLQGEYYQGDVAAGAKLGKAKRSADGASIYVTFAGTAHGNRVSEIAFINEFGKEGQPARPFVSIANELYADEANEAEQKVLDEHYQKHNF